MKRTGAPNGNLQHDYDSTRSQYGQCNVEGAPVIVGGNPYQSREPEQYPRQDVHIAIVPQGTGGVNG